MVGKSVVCSAVKYMAKKLQRIVWGKCIIIVIMNVEKCVILSDMLETVAGCNNVFSITTSEHGLRWERDYDKTAQDSGWEECVENHTAYLRSMAYEVYALVEIVRAKKIPYQHWIFNIN